MAALAVVAILDVVVSFALYRVFRPAGTSLARLAGGLRIAYAVGFAVPIWQLLPVTRYLGGELSSGTTAVRQAGVEAGIDHFNDVWHVALTLFFIWPPSRFTLGEPVFRRSWPCFWRSPAAGTSSTVR